MKTSFKATINAILNVLATIIIEQPSRNSGALKQQAITRESLPLVDNGFGTSCA